MAPVVVVVADAVFVVVPEVPVAEPQEARKTAITINKLRTTHKPFLFTFYLTVSTGTTSCIYEPEITSILYTILTQLDESLRRGCP